MNYFTEKELEEIANTLIENPTPATLRELDKKYNGTNEGEEKTLIPQDNMKNNAMNSNNDGLNKNIITNDIKSSIAEINTQENNLQNISNEKASVNSNNVIKDNMSNPISNNVNPFPEISIPTLNQIPDNEISNQNMINNKSIFNDLEINANSTTNNQQKNIPEPSIQNLWEMNNKNGSNPNLQNDMNQNQKLNSEQNASNFNSMPFFNPNVTSQQNIPQKQTNNSMPSMFGEFEQNYS